MTTDVNNGRLLANRYQLVELVGKGAMGRVYQARDMLLGGVTVAVKFLSQALLNKKMRDRFEREATISALLGEKSIHIVRVRDYGVDENEIPFYVMEFLNGESLSDVVRAHSLSLPRFLNLTRQICLGLQCAHNGIVFEHQLCPIIHRDIKPSNILVLQDTTLGDLVKVLDFGIAKLLQSDSAQTHSFMGTLAYCSPEQMEGRELDKRSDIYSLGVMMFEMLTGELPLMPETHSFGGWYKAHHFTPPRTLELVSTDLKLPKVLENLVMSCLAKEPRNRPQSADELLQALEPLEHRFGLGRQPSHRLGLAVSRMPVATQIIEKPPLAADQVCRLTSWPNDKPIAEIVFPHLIRTPQEMLPTLWVMLHKQEIQNRLVTTRYNQFLFLMSPHPMLLWITALYNREYGPRWLPCYLDLKTPIGQEMTRVVGQSGSYRLLFFAQEEPQRCANVTVSTIAKAQCKMLQEWANSSQMLVSAGVAHISKKLLRQEFEKLKPKILIKLESIHTDSPHDISG